MIKKNHAYLDPLFIFIAPPSLAVLRQRLESRKTDTPEAINERLAMSASEMAYARKGGHNVIVKNDNLERAYTVFKSAIQGTLQGSGDELPAEEDEEKKLREQV